MTSFLIAIVTRTPAWVWLLLAALIALGVAQMRERSVARRRLIVTPIVLAALSLAAVASTFGLHPAVEGPWIAGALLGALAGRLAPPPRGVQTLPDGRLRLPGSVLPLATFMAVFFTRYTVNVALAITPALGQQASFAAGVALLYGVPAGLIAARAQRVLGAAGRRTVLA